MMKIKILSLSIFASLLISCERLLFEADLASTDPMENFEYLWNECNEKYSYFDLKQVDWDDVKAEYSKKIFPEMSNDSLFNVLGGMLKELRDDHANLISNFRTSFFGVEYQAQDNFDWRIIVDNYITNDFIISAPFSHNFIANNKLGYVRLSTFSREIDEASLDYILERYANTEGLILDIRENGGGAISNVFKILSRLVDTETLVYYSQIKSGIGRNDFSELSEANVQPYDGIRYTKKIAILTDRGSYSSGSLLPLASKAIPNIKMIGDTTGGGLGIPNGGQLPNGWRYRFSITQTLTLDKKADYENGVPPDSLVLFDWNNLQKDEILEAAIDELLD